MISAPLPPNEKERLRVLQHLDILDTPPERAFDDITSLTAHIFNVPVVLVSLVDECRQWFKSSVGLDASETGRDVAFCSHAILGNDVLVINDARQDPRTHDNPLVTGPPYVVFYAGVPLTFPGTDARLGTLCLIDHEPRSLTEDEKETLSMLGKQVEFQLKVRHQLREKAFFGRMLEELQQLNESKAATFEDAVDQCLPVTKTLLGLDCAILSRVDSATGGGGQTYTVEHLHSVDDLILRGDAFPLSNTFCADVIVSGKTVHYHDTALSPDLCAHPAYQALPLESYVGTPVWVNGEIYGTLNFSSTRKRKLPFADGEIRFVEIVAASLGKKLELELAQKAREELEISSKRLLDSTLCGLYIYNFAEQRIHYRNPQAARILREDSDSIDYHSDDYIRSHVHADDLSSFLAYDDLIQQSSDDSIHKLEYRYLRGDDEWIWISEWSVPFERDASGRVNSCFTCFIDVTEQKTNEESLRRKNDELDRFASIAAHDLKAPLRQTSMLADLLTEQVGAEHIKGVASDSLIFMRKAIRNMSTLIDDLLAFSRAGEMTAVYEACDISEIVAEVLNARAKEVEKSRARIEVGPLPNIECDAERISQLFDNLIGNALKYVGHGIVPHISIQAERVGDRWKFSIFDNGIGVPPQHRDTIFDTFKRLHGSGEYEGTGIGLSICKKIVQVHSGSIWVDENKGGGSVFSFVVSDSPSRSKTLVA
ncbi:MAG: GAF domain-containing protein [Pseudomonadota bacterium]